MGLFVWNFSIMLPSNEGYGMVRTELSVLGGQMWSGGQRSEAVLMRSFYMNALFKASAIGLESIAFSLISPEIYCGVL